ncbi:MAG: cell division protein ZapB [Spirochaetaceae bacterium]|jgi:FtsZ-binding cell division protein ZapB|nr:cell division protein ZapB [Spirochaetaceae bacterium]
MVTIEQVELLESKVSRAIEYVKRLTAENERLKATSGRYASENSMLHGKLDGYQKRIAELEELLLGFKKDQERIEQGIIAALDRLNHFEDAVDTVSDDDVLSNGGAADDTKGADAGEAALGIDEAVYDGAGDVSAAESNDATADADMLASDSTADESDAIPDEFTVTQLANAALLLPLERETSADDAQDEAGDSEIFGDAESFEEDEFLGVLKGERVAVVEPAGAFAEEAPLEDVPAKTVAGAELDIF